MATVKVINGNMAAAIGAKLCRPDIIAAYPITPAASCTAPSARWSLSSPP